MLIFGLFLYGNLHYYNKVRVPLELKTSKPLPKTYKVVMASDLHLGYHNPRKELSRWVDMINAEKPDFILIAGDIIDGSMRPLLEEKMAEEFHRLTAPVYACLGNHEFYAGHPAAKQFLKDAGIRLLIDEAAVIDSSIVVIGREAGSGTRGAFEELLKIESKCKYAQELDSTGAVLAKVSSTPGAIGYVSLDAVDKKVKSASINGVAAAEKNIKSGDYKLARPFVMATKGEISQQNELVREWFAYLKSETGRKVITGVGLILPQ